MSILFNKLNEYSKSDFYGFHMPGHKRNADMLKSSIPYELDITEIEGFDDLHHAEGLLKEAQLRAARVYCADETHFLINGSTVGILSAVAGVTRKGDTVLVARNCHKSVYHAIYLNELNPVYLYPGFSLNAGLNTQISAEDVKRALKEHPDIRAVIIVSPTYDGVVSDVEAISRAAHEKKIPLIVDEAHGAHFGFHPYFPENSNTKGADIVIHSLHKTLPSLTQTALLHMNGEIVNRRLVRNYLHMLQSSSPSYILMASIDSCIDLLQNRSGELFSAYVQLLADTRKRLLGLKHLELVQTENFDRSKLIISVKNAGITSRRLYKTLLQDYHLQMEMTAGSYVLAMTTIGDTKEGMKRLAEALFEIDSALSGCAESLRDEEFVYVHGLQKAQALPRLEKVYSSATIAGLLEEIKEDNTAGKIIKTLPWKKCTGYISTEYAYLYPPGSPLIVPGEKISKEAADMLQWYQDMEFSIEGPDTEGQIEVWTDG